MEKLLNLVKELQEQLSSLEELLTEAGALEVPEPLEYCHKCNDKTLGLYNFNGELLYCKVCLSVQH